MDRLQEIKKALPILNLNGELKEDIDWLIEQAEKVEQLEKEIESLKERVQNLGVSVSNLLEENELLKLRKEEILVESGKRWEKLLQIHKILEQEIY